MTKQPLSSQALLLQAGGLEGFLFVAEGLLSHAPLPANVNTNANWSSTAIRLTGPDPTVCATATTSSPASINSTGTTSYPDSVFWFSS